MKIGDKVSVIDDDLDGVITSVHGNRIVFSDEHGFTHQFPKEKLIVKENVYDNLKTELKPESRKNTSKKHSKKDFILDLHFDQLVKNPQQYNATERLSIQKDQLLETLEFCRQNKIKKLKIVHGIGDGTLQKMVDYVLESQANLEYHNTDLFHQQSGAVIVYF